MDLAERERRHLAELARIEAVQRVAGHGDRARVDHEGTLLERARLLVEEVRSHRATEEGLAAFDRLLQQVEGRSTRHTVDIAQFVRAVRDETPLSLRTLRGLDREVADDMVAVLDAYRCGRACLVADVPGGAVRVAKALDS